MFKLKNEKLALYIYNKERSVAYSNIQMVNLLYAIAIHGDEVVSTGKDGYSKTFMQEVGEVGRITNTAFARRTMNFYRSRVSSYENDGPSASAAYVRAAKKIIFLNAVCKKRFNPEGFILKKIDLSDEACVKEFVESFDFVLRHMG